jgi:glycosyltransferase involved in cell wall biosynthesis
MDGISVVIPCFNSAAYLREALDSVLAQDYVGPVEVLIGDDGSTDDSVRLAESYGPPVRVLRSPAPPGRGCGAMRNLCLPEARFPLVAFQDADDVWLPNHLSALAGALAENPAAMLAYANGRRLTADGTPYGPLMVYRNPPLDADALLVKCCVVPPGVMVRRAVFAEVGPFDEALRYSQDHDQWLRIAERHPIVYVPAETYHYRQHPGQTTKKVDETWRYAGEVLRKAAARYPYRRASLRQRRGVIAYRRAEAAYRTGRYLRGTYFLGRAALADPGRAVGELVRRVRLSPLAPAAERGRG